MQHHHQREACLVRSSGFLPPKKLNHRRLIVPEKPFSTSRWQKLDLSNVCLSTLNTVVAISLGTAYLSWSLLLRDLPSFLLAAGAMNAKHQECQVIGIVKNENRQSDERGLRSTCSTCT